MHLSAAQFGLNLVYYCNTFCGASEEPNGLFGWRGEGGGVKGSRVV